MCDLFKRDIREYNTQRRLAGTLALASVISRSSAVIALTADITNAVAQSPLRILAQFYAHFLQFYCQNADRLYGTVTVLTLHPLSHQADRKSSRRQSFRDTW